MNRPYILEIKGNSLDDGPGIRSVVFFKGCPLSCLWCHNPESKASRVQLAFDPKECVACNTCLDTCPDKALDRNNPFFVDRSRCRLCFECTRVCPSGALSRVGIPMTVEQILAAVAKDQPFFETSGGGVTLSGGEATLFPDFLSQLLKALKSEGIHTLLETCGLFDFNRFQENLYPYIDMIYFDIKLFDNDQHKRYCGRPNTRILDNFRQLAALSADGHTDLLPRIPLVPGITDTDQNLRAIAGFLADHGQHRVELLSYHPLWQEKNRKIGIHEPTGDIPEMMRFLDKERLDRCQRLLIDNKIEVQ